MLLRQIVPLLLDPLCHATQGGTLATFHTTDPGASLEKSTDFEQVVQNRAACEKCHTGEALGQTSPSRLFVAVHLSDNDLLCPIRAKGQALYAKLIYAYTTYRT